MSEISEQQVVIKKIKTGKNGMLADKVHYECEFCNKLLVSTSENRKVCKTIAGDRFFCPFCLRHNFHNKSSKEILVMSFRAIIGHLYYELYANKARSRTLWISQITDYISAHMKVGLENPIFTYDPETMLWFVDFSKVGNGKKKVPLDVVLKTTKDIGDCFNLKYHLSHNTWRDINEKFNDAIEKFYSHRYRPKNKRFLIPSANEEVKEFKMLDMRNFSVKRMLIR